MRYSAITVSLACALVATSAAAEVTLSGVINAGIELEKSGDASTSAGNSITGPTTGGGSLTRSDLTQNYSFVNVGSKEDLGGGTKVEFNFQVYAAYASNTGINNRDSSIGLSNDKWGGLYYGTNDSIYNRWMWAFDPMDGDAGVGGSFQILGNPGYNTGCCGIASNTNFAGVPGVAAASANFFTRVDNTVWYNSPEYYGVSGGLYTSLSAYKSTTTPLDPKVSGLGVKWTMPFAPSTVFVTYQRNKDLNGLGVITSGASVSTTGTKDTGLLIGGSYTIADLTLYAMFERLKYTSDGLATSAVNEYARNAYSLNAKYNIPTGYVAFTFVKAASATCDLAGGGGCDASKTGAYSLGLGYYHTMSKSTQLYVVASYLKNDDLASYNIAGGNAGNGFDQFAAVGAKQEDITVGIVHAF